MNIREAVVKLFTGSLALALLEFVGIAAFTNVLGTSILGSFFLFRTILGIIGIPANLGVSRAAEKRLSAGESAGEIISTSVLIKAVLILPWIVGLLMGAGYVNQYIGIEDVSWLVALGIVGQQAEGLSIRLLSGQMMVHRTALLRVLGKVAWIIGGFGLIEMGLEPTSIIISFIAGNVVVVLSSLYLMELRLGRPSISQARSLINFGKYVFIGSAGGFVYQWMDVAILRLFAPPSVIGAYEIAWRVASLSMLLTRAVRESLFPKISEWHANDQLDEISDTFSTWLQAPLYVSIPAFFGIVVVGEDVLFTLFGEGVVIAYPALVIFGLEKISRSLHLLLSPTLFAIEKPQLAYRGSVVSIIVNLLLNFALIPQFGMVGAATATTVSAVASALVGGIYLSRFVALSLPRARIGWCIICSLAMGGVVYLLPTTLTNGVLQLAIDITVGILVYGVLILLMPSIRNDIMQGVERQLGSL